MLKQHPCIEIIHLNDGLMTAFALWLKKNYSLPVVATLHGLDIVFPLPYFQKTILPRFNVLDGFACVSEATAHAAISRGISKNKITVISNGVDHKLFSEPVNTEVLNTLMQRYHLNSDQTILIGLGRSVKRKGYSWFVKHVLPLLDNEFTFILCGPSTSYDAVFWRKFLPDRWIHFVELMFGLSSDEAELKKMAQLFPHRFVKTGYLPFDEVVQLMKRSGIFIMPNIPTEDDMEGFGLVALEACLAGCIVLASSTDGITDAIVNGKNGYLIPPLKADAWAEAIKEITSKKDKDIVKSSFQQYTLSHYSWQKMCQDYFLWFKDLI